MSEKLIYKMLVFGVILIFIKTNVASSFAIKEVNSSLECININEENITDNNMADNKGHIYFFVDFTITVRDSIFCNYLIFDIQGRDFIPYFNAIRFNPSNGDPVVDIHIRKMNGEPYDFTLTDSTFIFATMLRNVETDIPRFRISHNGYFQGTAFLLIFR